jgi:hypothetical protein
MANEDTVQYYQGLANDAQTLVASLTQAEAAGAAESARIQQQITSLQQQRSLAITAADRARIDNSITVNTNNLAKNNATLAQIQREKTAAQGRVTANTNLAREAAGGPPNTNAVQPAPVTPAVTATAPAAIPVNPTPTPVTTPARSAVEEGGEAAARVEPRQSPPEDFVFDRDGNLLPSDSSAAAERREEIAAEENRARAFDAVDRSGSTQSEGNAGEAAARVEPRRSPPEDFVFEEDGTLIPSDSSRAEERRAEIAAEEERARAFDAVDRSGSTQADGNEGEEQARANRPVPVAPNLSAAEDVEGTPPNNWGVWDNDQGVFIERGLSEQQAQEAAGDPFEALRVQREAEFAEDSPTSFGDTVPPNLSPAFDPDTQTWGIWDNDTGSFIQTGFATEETAAAAIGDGTDIGDDAGATGTLVARFFDSENGWGIFDTETGEFIQTGFASKEEAQAAINARPVPNEAAQDAATLEAARAQQALNERRRQANQGDWRVKLRLAPLADYLYKAPSPGILQPLAITDGVVFPYTPKIDLSYRAMYDMASLTHANYNNYFYKGSMLDPVNLTATFTAQDTAEANYMLAVIHFFRSVTKMFYGQDPQRGAPPPLVFFTGLGEYQFSEHPCVIHQFNYSLPADVDYIRARSVMDSGVDLQTRRDRESLPTNPVSSAIKRLSSLFEKITPGAEPTPPAPPTLGTNSPTYVPTRIDISLILYPIQSRSQVSKQFSLKQYANGDLLKGGFW